MPTSVSTVPSDSGRKRFQSKNLLHFPLIFLDGRGHVQHVTLPVSRMLGYQNPDDMDSFFFAWVHGKNLRQIARDIASMERGRKRQAFWLTRLRSADGRWVWYKISADNRLDAEEEAIVLRLRNLSD